jgi:hypothetical protein
MSRHPKRRWNYGYISWVRQSRKFKSPVTLQPSIMPLAQSPAARMQRFSATIMGESHDVLQYDKVLNKLSVWGW